MNLVEKFTKISRQDYCLNRMDPSDVRELLMEIRRLREALVTVANVGSGHAQQTALDALNNRGQ